MILGSWGPLNSRATCTGLVSPTSNRWTQLSTAPRGPAEGQTCTLCGWSWGLSSRESRCRGQGGGHLGALAGHVRGRWGHARLVPAASWPRSWLHPPRNGAGPKASARLGTSRGRCCGQAHLRDKTTKGESHSSKELSKEMESTTIQSNRLRSLRSDVITVFWKFPRPPLSRVFSTAQSLPFRPRGFSLQTAAALLRLTFDLVWLRVLASHHSLFSGNQLSQGQFLEPSLEGQIRELSCLKLKLP